MFQQKNINIFKGQYYELNIATLEIMLTAPLIEKKTTRFYFLLELTVRLQRKKGSLMYFNQFYTKTMYRIKLISVNMMIKYYIWLIVNKALFQRIKHNLN